MRNRIAVWAGCLLVLALGGCATPDDLTRDGERFDFTTALTPYAASICIARNARSYSSGSSGEERLLGQTSTEVVMRSGGDALATAQIHRSEGVMSRVSIWVARSVRSDRRGLAAHLMKGC